MIRTRILQLLIILFPTVLFGWLVLQEVVPSGIFRVEHSIQDSSPFIDPLMPDARVGDVHEDFFGDTVQTIMDDPVFFFVHPHRGFEKVDVEVWFKNESAPILEIGALAQKEGQVYDLKPLQNLTIDASPWARLETAGVTLLQREKTYGSIADFLVDPPPSHEIATYNYTLARPYRIEGYTPSRESRTIDVSLRGFHELKTYVENERLDFEIQYMDMNRDEGGDAFSIAVFDEKGRTVHEEFVRDDGNVRADAKADELRSVHLVLPEVSTGVYKIEFRAGRDIFFRRMITPQQKIVFLNNLYLGDEVGWQAVPRAVQFWTEAKHLDFQTQHASGLQELLVGKEIAAVTEPYRRFPVEVLEDGVVKVASPTGDLLIHTDGHVAFSPEQFFNPDAVRLRAQTDLDRLGVNYVIASYSPPERQGNWLVNTATFDTSLLVFEGGAWKFTFSIPGISDLGASVDVGRIDMTWHREPFRFSDLWEALKRKSSL